MNKKLDKGILKLWLLIGAFFFTLVVAISILAYVFMIEKLKVATLITGIILIVIACLLCFIYPILRHKYYTYRMDDKTIIINRGVIFKECIFVPICQIQDLHISQSPFEILFHISKLEVSTAGSNYKIVGLKKDIAQSIVDELQISLEKRLEELSDEKI